MNLEFMQVYYLIQDKAKDQIEKSKQSDDTIYKAERLAAAEALLQLADELSNINP